MITIKMIEDAAIKGVHAAKAEIKVLEDKVALELISAGKAIRHVVSEVEAKFKGRKPASGMTATAPGAPETAANPPAVNPNLAKIAYLKAQIATIEAAPLPPPSDQSSTPAVLAAGRAADIAALQEQITALGG